MNKTAIFIIIVLCVTMVQPSLESLSMTNSSAEEMFHLSLVSDPNPASDPVPEDGAINVERTITLSWTTTSSTPDDDISYNVFFGTTPNPENVEIVYPHTSYDPGLLEYNTQYYWRIDTYSNDGAATGFLWTFRTKDDTPPNKPIHPQPNHEETNVNRSIILSWEGSDPDDDPISYDIYFGTQLNPPLVQAKQNDSFYNPGVLVYNTEYFWRIDTWDDYGYSTTGDLWSFTIKDDTPPYLPSTPSPMNNSVNTSLSSLLTWEGGDPDGDQVTYDVYFGTDLNPPLVSHQQNYTYFITGNLSYYTQYFWRIDAWDDYGYSTTGETWTFTTRNNLPPSVPFNPQPANGSTNIYIDATLSWECTDPDDEQITFDVYFGTLENPSVVSVNQTSMTYQPPVMNTTTTYYWFIVAHDETGHETRGQIWEFTTSIYENNPPDKPDRPLGPTSGKVGISYTYSSSTTDSNGEPVYYMFDWDDGSTHEWIGPFDSGQSITVSHVWDEQGSYAIKVKAKDIYGGESFWSDPLQVSLPKIKMDTHPVFSFLLDILFEVFPWFATFFSSMG